MRAYESELCVKLRYSTYEHTRQAGVWPYGFGRVCPEVFGCRLNILPMIANAAYIITRKAVIPNPMAASRAATTSPSDQRGG